jgi:chromosome segregation ATPase
MDPVIANILNGLEQQYQTILNKFNSLESDIMSYEVNINNLENHLEQIQSTLYEPDTPHGVALQTINNIMNTLNQQNEHVRQLNIESDKLQNNLDRISQKKSFLRLTTLPSFQNRNLQATDKVLSNAHLSNKISSYLGGRYTRKNKKRKNKLDKRKKKIDIKTI